MGLEFEVDYSRLQYVICDVKYDDTNFLNYCQRPTFVELIERWVWTRSECYSSMIFWNGLSVY